MWRTHTHETLPGCKGHSQLPLSLGNLVKSSVSLSTDDMCGIPLFCYCGEAVLRILECSIASWTRPPQQKPDVPPKMTLLRNTTHSPSIINHSSLLSEVLLSVVFVTRGQPWSEIEVEIFRNTQTHGL